jgi:stage V sporulation protein SpoVS
MRMEYLVIGPKTRPDKHARYMLRRLLGDWRKAADNGADNSSSSSSSSSSGADVGGKVGSSTSHITPTAAGGGGFAAGAMLLLFHDQRGAGIALAALAAASELLERKHGCTLVCQVALTPHDPLRMRLLARLWPYAGTLGSVARADGDPQAADPVATAPPAAAAAAEKTGSVTAAVAGTAQRRRPGWMRRSLVGAIPSPEALPPAVRKLPPLAVPQQMRASLCFAAARTTDPRRLAGSVATAIKLRGRCRLSAAGGLAGRQALMAVAMAELLLAQTRHPRSLVMHVASRRTTRTQQQQADLVQQGTSGVGAAGSADGPVPDGGDAQEEQQQAGPADLDRQQLTHRPAAPSLSFYELTLLAAHRDQHATPATCVFAPQRRGPRGGTAAAAPPGQGEAEAALE